MSGGGGPPVGAAHDPDGSAASSSPAPDAALLAPAGVTGPVRSARGATPPIGPRAPTQRVALLERRPTTVLQVSAVRAAAVGTLAYRAADALARAGVHAWSTGAPPPSRSV